VWGITFLLTVIEDLTVAVAAGMILALLLYIRRVTTTTTVARITREYIEHGRRHSLHLHDIRDHVAIFRIHGPFLSAAATSCSTFSKTRPLFPTRSF
jgi:sulfate permease, SulP family